MSTARITVPITQIRIGERIRTDFGDLDELIQSFKDNETDGKPRLIHPIVVDSDYTLIDGGRRLEAHKQAGYTDIDIAFYAVLDEGIRMRLEVDANKHKRFNWQEACLAVERYHRFYETRAVLKHQEWTLRETGSLLGRSKSSVHYCLLLAAPIRANDPEIIKAKTMEDAIAVLLARKQAEAQKRLVQMTIKSTPAGVALLNVDVATGKPVETAEDFFADLEADGERTANAQFTPGIVGPSGDDETPGQRPVAPVTVVPLSQMLFRTDCVEWMRANPASVNHIITDIPYGIDMANLQQSTSGMDVSSVAAEHDVDANIDLFKRFFPVAYDCIKDSGFLITWMDQMHWNLMYDLATAAGFKVQRWPLTWHKTHTCMNQMAYTNFTKNTEIAMVCRKGTIQLVRPQSSSVWTGSNDIEARTLGHPFVKPAGLWTWLYEAVCLKGQTVLDPFAGVGSSTVPAIRYGLKPITCEINQSHWEQQVVNIQNLYLSLDQSVKFS